MDSKTLSEILKGFGPDARELITILHRVQEAFGHVPREAVSAIARHLGLTDNEIYGVLTFYRAFSLQPKGRYVIKVCLGTACHVRGGVEVADELSRRLSLAPGKTSADGKFSLETVNCLGCCAIGPVVVVNEEYHANVSLSKVEGLLAGIGKGEEKA